MSIFVTSRNLTELLCFLPLNVKYRHQGASRPLCPEPSAWDQLWETGGSPGFRGHEASGDVTVCARHWPAARRTRCPEGSTCTLHAGPCFPVVTVSLGPPNTGKVWKPNLPSKAPTPSHRDHGQLSEQVPGRVSEQSQGQAAASRQGAPQPTPLQASPQPAGLGSRPSQPRPPEARGPDPTAAQHIAPLGLHQHPQGEGARRLLEAHSS